MLVAFLRLAWHGVFWGGDNFQYIHHKSPVLLASRAAAVPSPFQIAKKKRLTLAVGCVRSLRVTSSVKPFSRSCWFHSYLVAGIGSLPHTASMVILMAATQSTVSCNSVLRPRHKPSSWILIFRPVFIFHFHYDLCTWYYSATIEFQNSVQADQVEGVFFWLSNFTPISSLQGWWTRPGSNPDGSQCIMKWECGLPGPVRVPYRLLRWPKHVPRQPSVDNLRLEDITTTPTWQHVVSIPYMIRGGQAPLVRVAKRHRFGSGWFAGESSPLAIEGRRRLQWSLCVGIASDLNVLLLALCAEVLAVIGRLALCRSLSAAAMLMLMLTFWHNEPWPFRRRTRTGREGSTGSTWNSARITLPR